MGIYKRNDTYYIDYHFEGCRFRETVGLNKRMAEKALAKRMTQIAEGKFIEVVKKSNTMFDELAERYMKWSKTNKRSCERDQRCIRLLRQKFSDLKIDRITPLLVEDYKQERLSVVKGSTVNRELACLRGMGY